MSGIQNHHEFFEKLKARLVELGLQDGVASAAAKSVHPIKKEGNTVIAECKSIFYRDTILKPRKNEISLIAKECWGHDVDILFRSDSENHSAPVQKRRSRVRHDENTSRLLFDFAETGMPLSGSQPNSRSSSQTTKHPAAPIVQMKGAKTAQQPPPPQPAATSTSARRQSSSQNEPVKLQAKPNIDSISRSTEVTPNPISEEGENTSSLNIEVGSARNNLIQDFMFSTFVRGQSNLVAFSACEAVTQNPGNLTNPVFLYGATGLGKTHLLHSVGNEIQRSHPEWKIIYVTSGDFMIEHIASIRFNKQEMFRNKYRQCDVLLVDDIQFLERKENTQLEFFHTFNELYQRKKQIVITSDKYPKDIPNISERLKSRFVEGLIAEIEPPSFEDRLAIVEAKSRMMGLRLSSDLIQYISENVKANVREIQGVLNNILMNQSMSGKPPTLELIMNLLKRIVRQPSTVLSVDSIQRAVAANFNLRVSDLLAPTRTQRLVLPRHIAMYLSSVMLDCSTTEIAEAFAKKDHTTVLHAISKVKQLLEKDVSTRATVNEIRRKLDQNLD